MVKTDCLVIRITSELKAQLRVAAEADGRSVSNYVIMLIRSSLDKN